MSAVLPGAVIVFEYSPAPVDARPQWLGDPRELIARLGAPGVAEPAPLAVDLARARVVDLASLRQFLRAYQNEVLIPVELPLIQRAHQHAGRYEVRELIALDQGLRSEPRLQRFAAASQAVGRSQLRRLLPMRDQRLVRRYWQAVEAGQAHAWHPLVYGVVLSLFSLPLRQGLLGYSRQTLGGFVDTAAGALRLGENARSALEVEFLDGLPMLVGGALTDRRGLRLVPAR